MTTQRNYGLWNRRLHYFLGLYFLLFIWLFAATGLLLNHHWSFAEFWPNRKTTSFERDIQVPPSTAMPLEQARDVMRQLDIAGEIQWVATKPDATQFEFRVTRPGHNFEIKADWRQRRASVQRADVNAWGVMHMLHTFTGVRLNDPKNERDWLLTTIWAWSMDAVAIGLMVLVLSGLVMWWSLPAKRLRGVVALAAGVLICGWFVYGLRWFGG